MHRLLEKISFQNLDYDEIGKVFFSIGTGEFFGETKTSIEPKIRALNQLIWISFFAEPFLDSITSVVLDLIANAYQEGYITKITRRSLVESVEKYTKDYPFVKIDRPTLYDICSMCEYSCHSKYHLDGDGYNNTIAFVDLFRRYFNLQKHLLDNLILFDLECPAIFGYTCSVFNATPEFIQEQVLMWYDFNYKIFSEQVVLFEPNPELDYI